MYELSQIYLRVWILEDIMFENKNKILMFILTGEHQHQTPNIKILGWERICMVKKHFGLVLMFPSLREDQN